MKKKTVYAVFTTTDSGMDYMVRGNFGGDKVKASEWANANIGDKYPRGLFVKQVKY